MHSYNSFLFYPLQSSMQAGFLSVLKVSTSAEFCKASDDKMPDLMKLGVAADQEHVSCDSVLKHLSACDTIVAKRKEYPRDICLDVDIVY
jgi:hypothetical protein